MTFLYIMQMILEFCRDNNDYDLLTKPIKSIERFTIEFEDGSCCYIRNDQLFFYE